MRGWGIVLCFLFSREMPVGVRHQIGMEELAPERLSEIHTPCFENIVQKGACGE